MKRVTKEIPGSQFYGVLRTQMILGNLNLQKIKEDMENILTVTLIKSKVMGVGSVTFYYIFIQRILKK